MVHWLLVGRGGLLGVCHDEGTTKVSQGVAGNIVDEATQNLSHRKLIPKEKGISHPLNRPVTCLGH